MIGKLCSAAAIAAIALAAAAPARAQPTVQVGVLTCNVASGWGFVFGSSRALRCTFSGGPRRFEYYAGRISKFGVDVGYTASSVIMWGVFAPTANLAPGALSGDYVGATGSAAVGVGAGANVLVGGSRRSVSLQPVSISGGTGLNVAAGVASITLHRMGRR